MVMLGTKCPSITSTCITLAPPSAAALTCSAKWAKSEDKIDGASSISWAPGMGILAKILTCLKGTKRRLPHLL